MEPSIVDVVQPPSCARWDLVARDELAVTIAKLGTPERCLQT